MKSVPFCKNAFLLPIKCRIVCVWLWMWKVLQSEEVVCILNSCSDFALNVNDHAYMCSTLFYNLILIYGYVLLGS